MDREKVIKGLECCCTHIVGMNCGRCPYEDDDISYCTSALTYDALALLKEQQQRIEILESLRKIEQTGSD